MNGRSLRLLVLLAILATTAFGLSACEETPPAEEGGDTATEGEADNPY